GRRPVRAGPAAGPANHGPPAPPVVAARLPRGVPAQPPPRPRPDPARRPVSRRPGQCRRSRRTPGALLRLPLAAGAARTPGRLQPGTSLLKLSRAVGHFFVHLVAPF